MSTDVTLTGVDGRYLLCSDGHRHAVPHYVTEVACDVDGKRVLFRHHLPGYPDAPASRMGFGVVLGSPLIRVQAGFVHLANNLYVRAMHALGFGCGYDECCRLGFGVELADKRLRDGWTPPGDPQYTPLPTFSLALEACGLRRWPNTDFDLYGALTRHRKEVLRHWQDVQAWRRWPERVDELNEAARLREYVAAAVRVLQSNDDGPGQLLMSLLSCATVVAEHFEQREWLQRWCLGIVTEGGRLLEVTDTGSNGAPQFIDGKLTPPPGRFETATKLFHRLQAAATGDPTQADDCCGSAACDHGDCDATTKQQPAAQPERQPCNCPKDVLMANGCRCGGV